MKQIKGAEWEEIKRLKFAAEEAEADYRSALASLQQALIRSHRKANVPTGKFIVDDDGNFIPRPRQ